MKNRLLAIVASVAILLFPGHALSDTVYTLDHEVFTGDINSTNDTLIVLDDNNLLTHVFNAKSEFNGGHYDIQIRRDIAFTDAISLRQALTPIAAQPQYLSTNSFVTNAFRNTISSLGAFVSNNPLGLTNTSIFDCASVSNCLFSTTYVSAGQNIFSYFTPTGTLGTEFTSSAWLSNSGFWFYGRVESAVLASNSGNRVNVAELNQYTLDHLASNVSAPLALGSLVMLGFAMMRRNGRA